MKKRQSKLTGIEILKGGNVKRTLREKLEALPLAVYVCISLGLIIIYSIVELIISTISGVSHDTLTTCFYSVFGGEIVSCALIKIFKLKEEGDDDKYDE